MLEPLHDQFSNVIGCATNKGLCQNVCIQNASVRVNEQFQMQVLDNISAIFGYLDWADNN